MPFARVSMPVALIVVMCAGVCADVNLEYALDLTASDSGIARVTMTARGLTGGGVELRRDAVAGAAWFDSVRAFDAGGGVLQVVPTESGWYVTTSKAESIRVEYIIKAGEVRQNVHIGLIASGFAALDGSMVFLVPRGDFSLGDVCLRAQVPPGWRLVTAWLEDGGAFHPDTAVASAEAMLGKSLVCAGPFQRVTRRFGLNEVNVWTLLNYPGPDAAALAEVLFRIYGEIHSQLSCDTGVPYNVVCLPPSPDGLFSGAGGWIDGQALTLAGKYTGLQSLRVAQLFGRFVCQGYLTEKPLGVVLSDSDMWFGPAAWRYCEMLAGDLTGKQNQDSFYSVLYEEYAPQAARDVSDLDLPLAEFPHARGQARDFLMETKAPLLLMRMDFEIRAASDNEKNIADFLRFFSNKARGGKSVGVFASLGEFLNADASELETQFVRKRDVILPTWPQFLERISSVNASPGEVMAYVDGIPIYQREVDIMVDALLSQGTVAERTDVAKLALAALVNEKLMDKTLAAYQINVIPEAFWRLRMVMPASVASVIIAIKRQAVKDALYDDWLQTVRSQAKLELKEVTKRPAPGPAPAAGPR